MNKLLQKSAISLNFFLDFPLLPFGWFVYRQINKNRIQQMCGAIVSFCCCYCCCCYDGDDVHWRCLNANQQTIICYFLVFIYSILPLFIIHRYVTFYRFKSVAGWNEKRLKCHKNEWKTVNFVISPRKIRMKRTQNKKTIDWKKK